MNFNFERASFARNLENGYQLPSKMFKSPLEVSGFVTADFRIFSLMSFCCHENNQRFERVMFWV